MKVEDGPGHGEYIIYENKDERKTIEVRCCICGNRIKMRLEDHPLLGQTLSPIGKTAEIFRAIRDSEKRLHIWVIHSDCEIEYMRKLMKAIHSTD
ncbi:MAG: hypothetical protein ACTSUO_00795 [Candidatus Thorarchaeota archaeon]